MNRIYEWLFGMSASDVAGAHDWSLRFTGMPENAATLLAAFALLGVLAWLTIRNYRRESAASKLVRTSIAAIRVATLVVLFFVFLQPALMVRFERVQTSAAVVLIDDSLSMQWKDRYSDEKRSAALAKLLGIKEERLVGDDRIARTEAVRRALSREGGALARLAEKHPLILHRFGKTSGDSSTYVESLGETEAGTAAPRVLETVNKGLARLNSDGQHTDLARALREVLNTHEGRRLAAVIVVSDGRNTTAGASRLAGAAQVASQRGVPVFSVAVGDPVPPGNVAVTQLLGPREARAASRISFTALVTHRSLPKRTAQVKLLRSRPGQEGWEDTGVAAEVTVGGEQPPAKDGARGEQGAIQEVVLETEAPAVGVYVYKAQIQPLREDSISGDNEATAVVRVTDQKTKVLLVGGSASWEFQGVRSFLLRSKEHYAVSVWQQNADARFNQDASAGMRRASLPTTIEELAAYDVVILCDPRPAPGSMDERFVGLLDQFVSKHQGGLFYLAGNKFSGKTLARDGEFASLTAMLPIVPATDQGGSLQGDDRQGAPITLTPDGQAHPIFKLKADARENLETWQRLPGVFRRHKVADVKSLATSLAVRGDANLMPGERQETIMAAQHYGRGNVLYAGFDGTWRWRSLDKAAHYEKFWANAMEFLGSGRLEKKRIVVTTPAEVFDSGTEIEARVEAYTRDMNPMDAKGLILDVRSLESGDITKHPLRRERAGLYVGSIRLDRVGAYELDVKTDDKGASDWTPDDVAARRIGVRLPQAEFWKPEADYDALRALATNADGFLHLDEVDALADRIPEGKTTAIMDVAHALWSTKFMLILLGLLLLTELTLRKWFNMM
jgi:hypothetical protein